MRNWAPGDFLTHRFNHELGVGRVIALDGRTLVVEFPRSGTRLRLAADTDALAPVDLGPGRPVRIVTSQDETTITGRRPDGNVELANGQIVSPHALWPRELEGALLERLTLGDLDDPADFRTRLDVLRLLSLREAGGLGSFLGGRVRLYPHQLYVAERASAGDPVRWLLADEVGLGKTIEAALILNRLVHTGRVERCLVVAPDALTVQWLGELWRKYHQVFTLLDGPRLADVARDFGSDFNPFDVHRRVVVGLEMLVERPHLTDQAVSAGIDLLVVDEAQRLRRPPGHPGEPAYRAIAPIAALGRHLLLLSATPLEEDVHGFLRLLQLLRPDEFSDDERVEVRLASGTPVPPCVSSTRRSDIGGLPPRIGIPVEEGPPARWEARSRLEGIVRGTAASDAVARRKKLDRVRRVVASGAALHAVLGPDERALREQTDVVDRVDPRLAWLLAQAPRWKHAREKTLLFVAHRETLEMLRSALSSRAQLASGVFHEELSPARRDTEAARFREADGPSLLVSTECGGEGRNFEFCRRLVLYDLPWRPSVVEQRIGRLDRIGRRLPVEIVYFRPSSGVGRDVVRLFEALGVFREPLTGLEPQLATVERALDEIALDPEASLSDARLDELAGAATALRSRSHVAAHQLMTRDPYRREMAGDLLSRIPAELDGLNEHVVVALCGRLGFAVERTRGRSYAIELGSDSVVDGLPGVPGGSAYVGTFDREEAVQDEALDFFASGHALVEGLFAYVEDRPFGRVARIAVEIGGTPGRGLAAIYRDGPGFDVVVFDATGHARPEWAEAFRGPLQTSRVKDDTLSDDDWAELIGRLGTKLDPGRRLHALAAIVVRPRR